MILKGPEVQFLLEISIIPEKPLKSVDLQIFQ